MNRAGTPDIMAFKRTWLGTKEAYLEAADLIFIECKRPGNKATPLQTAVMKELESFGARCFVATSIEDVEAFL